jgi:hypothetical protein
MSKVMYRLKRFLSEIYPNRINHGIGVTTDNSILLSEMPSQQQIEKASTKTNCIYDIQNDVGGFELIGFIKKDKIVYYQLKHIKTGLLINVTKTILDALYIKRSNTK